jgi:hypothetical protein
MRVDYVETKELALTDTEISKIQGVLYCGVPEDLILFRNNSI